MLSGPSRACSCKGLEIKRTLRAQRVLAFFGKAPPKWHSRSRRLSNTTPTTKNPLKSLFSEGFSFHTDKCADKAGFPEAK